MRMPDRWSIYAPTFGANRETLKGMGLEANVEILNRELVKRTKENVGDRVLIAGDMSTTGKGLEPYGLMTYDSMMEIYKEQITLLAEAGVDLLVAETLYVPG